MQTRRSFITRTTAGGLGLFIGSRLGGSTLIARLEAATLSGVPQFVTPLLIPPVMPRASVLRLRGGKNVDYYEISVRQFGQ
jgi:spore coat protein A, manganese oxidase